MQVLGPLPQSQSRVWGGTREALLYQAAPWDFLLSSVYLIFSVSLSFLLLKFYILRTRMMNPHILITGVSPIHFWPLFPLPFIY